MKLRNFISNASFPSEGYFGVAVRKFSHERRHTFAAGWNGLDSVAFATSPSIPSSVFPEDFPELHRRFLNNEVAIHTTIKGVLSDSVYDFIFSRNASLELSLIVFLFKDATGKELVHSQFLNNLEECRDFYKTYVQE